MSAPWSRPGPALVAAAVLLLSGCGVLTSAGNQDLPSVPVASQQAASAGADRPAAPKGSRWVIATHSRIQMVVPSTWKTLDWAAAVKSADKAKLAAIAKSANSTVAELMAETKIIDLYLMSPSNAYSGIAVDVKPGAALPTTAALKKDYTAHKSTVTKTWAVKTAVGDGMAMLYHYTVNGKACYGQNLTIETDEGLVAIDVNAASAAEVQKVAKPLLSSLRPADI